MSYCDFNNAFKNMDHKILETFDGITSEDLSFNLVSSEEESIQNHPAKNSILSNITNNGKNLNGTSIHHLNNINQNNINQNNINQNNINQNNINQNLQNTNKYNSYNSNKNINLNNNNKLTHRECIQLYLNPLNNKNPNYELAHRHIIICSLCQNEINKKMQESFQTVNTQVNTTPINIVDRTTTIQDVKAANKSITNQSNDNAESKVLSLSMRDLEVLLKNITERTSNDKTEHFSRIIQKLDDNERNKPFCIELNFLNITVCLLIILLLIDIVLRLKK